ncbi:unnamed protein product [Amoebophrya sp. A120]|nr:unnamed protein product [Amoebophrya sp. A120]|eukprot:GSA120T00007596001.1
MMLTERKRESGHSKKPLTTERNREKIKDEKPHTTEKRRIRRADTAASETSLANNRQKSNDPSALHLDHPLSCPAVSDAQEFFFAQLPNYRKFLVHLGSTKGWRTVSKLHVRTNYLATKAWQTTSKAKQEEEREDRSRARPRCTFQVLAHTKLNKCQAWGRRGGPSVSSWVRWERQFNAQEICEAVRPTVSQEYDGSDELQAVAGTPTAQTRQERFHVSLQAPAQDVTFDTYGRCQQVVCEKASLLGAAAGASLNRLQSSSLGAQVPGKPRTSCTTSSKTVTVTATDSAALTLSSSLAVSKPGSAGTAPAVEVTTGGAGAQRIRKPVCHCEIGMLEPTAAGTAPAGAKKAKSHSKHARCPSSSSTVDTTKKTHLPSQSMTLVDLSRKKHKSEAHHPVLDRAIQFLRKCIEQCGVPDFRSAVERGEVEFEEKEEVSPPPRKKRKVAASASTEPAELGKATTTKGVSSTASRDTTSNKASHPVVLHDPQFRKTKSDTLRYVFFGVERATNRAQITLVWNSDEFEKCENLGTLVHEIMTQMAANGTDSTSSSNNVSPSPCFLHSLWVHSNRLSIHGNCFFEDTGRWLNVFGPNDGCVLERMVKGNGSADHHGTTPYLFLPPNVFRQANLKEFGQICLKVRECVVGFAAAKASAAAKAGKSGSGAEHSLKDKKEAHNTDEAAEANKNTISVLELYGGVGTIGLQLLNCTTQAPASTPSDKNNGPAQTSAKDPKAPQRTEALISRYECSDANPFNKACFEKSLALMEQCSSSTAGGAAAVPPHNKASSAGSRPSSIFQQTEITYTPKPAKEMVDRIPHYDVLIVDPPRKGLDAEVIEALTKQDMKTDLHHDHASVNKPSASKKKKTGAIPTASGKKSGLSSPPQRVIYISCGFPAFKRDCEKLVSSGMWKLTRAEGFVLFPGADHIETFAVFDRVI